MNGIVYFLTNRSMPNLVKIGHTQGNLEERVRQLSGTSVARPFDVSASFYVRESAETERLVHEKLVAYRYSQNREFFEGALRFLLTETLPILLEAMEYGDLESDSITPNRHSFDERSIRLLQGLAICRNHRASTILNLVDKKESELEVLYKLAKFKEFGYVSERKKPLASEWTITTEGITFLFENNLVNQDMLRDPFGI
jgi:T5orf172 domain